MSFVTPEIIARARTHYDGGRAYHNWSHREGRGAVLERFLLRPAIFTMPALHERFEAAARRNLRAAIEVLGR